MTVVNTHICLMFCQNLTKLFYCFISVVNTLHYLPREWTETYHRFLRLNSSAAIGYILTSFRNISLRFALYCLFLLLILAYRSRKSLYVSTKEILI